MTEQKTIKVFMIHQFIMSDLQKKVRGWLETYPDCKFIDLSLSEDRPIPRGHLDFIQDYACGYMMESDIIVILPDTEIGDDVPFGSYLSELGGTFNEIRGLPHNKVFTQEILTAMYDSCDTKPVLVLGWTKERAGLLAEEIKTGSRQNDKHRFYAMELNEVTGAEDIPKKIISILDSWETSTRTRSILSQADADDDAP